MRRTKKPGGRRRHRRRGFARGDEAYVRGTGALVLYGLPSPVRERALEQAAGASRTDPGPDDGQEIVS